jgi:hypothetical protein
MPPYVRLDSVEIYECKKYIIKYTNVGAKHSKFLPTRNESRQLLSEIVRFSRVYDHIA